MLGLEALIDDTVRLDGRVAGSGSGRKVLSLVASMLVGGCCIDDVQRLRSGSAAAVLPFAVVAPSTAGSFLRSFTFGHVRQLDKAAEMALRRAWSVGAAPDVAEMTVDLDSTVCEVCGRAKHGAAYGHTKVLGYHPLVAVRSDSCGGVVEAGRDHRDGGGRGAAWVSVPRPRGGASQGRHPARRCRHRHVTSPDDGDHDRRVHRRRLPRQSRPGRLGLGRARRPVGERTGPAQHQPADGGPSRPRRAEQPRRPVEGLLGLDLRGQLLPRPVARRLDPPRVGELQTPARSQPRPLGAADRAVPAAAGRAAVPMGARPLREPLERGSRPASHRGRPTLNKRRARSLLRQGRHRSKTRVVRTSTRSRPSHWCCGPRPAASSSRAATTRTITTFSAWDHSTPGEDETGGPAGSGPVAFIAVLLSRSCRSARHNKGSRLTVRGSRCGLGTQRQCVLNINQTGIS